MIRQLPRAVGLGALYAALYGLVIAWLHVRSNGVGHWGDALVIGLWLGVLFGLAGAVLTAVLGAPIAALGELARRRAMRAEREAGAGLGARTPTGQGARFDWPLACGLIAFGGAFWLPFFLYGLTYDQTIVFHPRSGEGMAAYLAVAALLLVVAVVAVSIGLVVAAERLARSGLLVRVPALLVAGAVVVLVVTALATPAAESPRSPATAAESPEGPATAAESPEGPVTVAEIAGGDEASSEDGSPSAAAGVVEEEAAHDQSVESVIAAATERELPFEVADTGIDVVIVGFDGLDPRVVERLVQAGMMPTFERLRREGVFGELETLHDSNSAVIWASIYSGLTPSRHGIHDFYQVHLAGVGQGLYPVHRTFFKEAAGVLEGMGLARRVVVTRSTLAAPLVWEIADFAGLSIGVVDGYLYSFPALRPATVGSAVVAYGADGFASALERGKARARELDLYVQPRGVLEGLGLPEGDDFAWQSRLALSLLERGPQPRLLNIYTHQPDSVQHQHWRAFEPERYLGASLEATGERGDDPVTAMHRRFDAFLEALVEHVGPSTALLVVSDHGHSPTLVHSMDTQHRHGPPGTFLLWGSAFVEGYRYTRRPVDIYDIAPTVLYLLGLPVARDLPGRVLTETLSPELAERLPVRTVATYDGLVPRPAAIERREDANRAEIDKLRRLGYVQ